MAGAKGGLKGPVRTKAGKVDSGYFGGLDWQAQSETKEPYLLSQITDWVSASVALSF